MMKKPQSQVEHSLAQMVSTSQKIETKRALPQPKLF
jgi:hypothetical protein